MKASAPDTASASILRQATTLYRYGPERAPMAINDPKFPGPTVSDSGLPRVTIATATINPGAPPPAYRIIARITSDAAYPAMGLGAGYNYIWRNSWDSKVASTWVTKVVSSDTSASPHLLTRDARLLEYSHGESAREPRLVKIKVHSRALGVCIDDPICPIGHCGYY